MYNMHKNRSKFFVTFVNTYVREYDIIILVKPPIHYI